MAKKDPSATSFGEMMSQLGVKKQDLLKKPTPKPATRGATRRRVQPAARPLTDPRREAMGSSSTHRAEVNQLLESVNVLQQQRDNLRAALRERDEQVEQDAAAIADMRLKVRNLESLRRTDMDLITRLRRELASATDRLLTVSKARDTLQRTVTRLSTAQAAPAPVPVPAPLQAPEGDSDIRQAAFAVASACRGLGVQRLAIVGGTPSYHSRLRELFGDAIALRLVDGAERRTQKQARGDIDWADLVIIWGGTILDHSTSQHYKGDSVTTIAHRGLAGMLRTLADELS